MYVIILFFLNHNKKNDVFNGWKKVHGNFPIDISLQLLEKFHQINNHFKEHLKVHLFCKNKGSNSRNKRESIKKVCYMCFGSQKTVL
jgi:hypothetical protein